MNNGSVYDTYGWVKYLAGDVHGAIRGVEPGVAGGAVGGDVFAFGEGVYEVGRQGSARLAAEEGMRLGKEKNDPAEPELEKIYKETGQ